jgi:hypothetical protein
LTYPILLDGGQIGAAYRVGSLPTTVIVDREGVVRERIVDHSFFGGIKRS